MRERAIWLFTAAQRPAYGLIRDYANFGVEIRCTHIKKGYLRGTLRWFQIFLSGGEL